MSVGKHAFTNAERFAVWSAFEGRCYWCLEPIRLQDTTVDHLLPEALQHNPAEFADIVAFYGLAASYSLNSFANWVPAHGHCNYKKGARVLAKSQFMALALADLAVRATDAEKTHTIVVNDRRKDKILGRLMVAIERGKISREDVLELLEGMPSAKPIAATQAPLMIAPDWEVVNVSHGIATVQRNNRIGVTPIVSDPHPTWICGFCGSLGPWNGARCESCGYMSEPWD